MPHPPIRRALQMAKENVQAAGQQVNEHDAVSVRGLYQDLVYTVVLLHAYKHAYGDGKTF